MTGYIPVRNNHHTPIHTPLDDHWVTHNHASNPATYPGHLTFSPQVDGRNPMFEELPLVRRASPAATTDLVSTLPYRGHASFQFNGQAKHHDGTSACHQPFGEENGSEESWLAPSNSLMSPSQDLHPSYSGGTNILTSTNPPICRISHAETTASVTVPNVLYESATGMTSGGVGDVILIFRNSSIAL